MSKISARPSIESRHREDTGIDDTGASGGSEAGRLYSHAKGYRLEFNHVRPLCWNRPVDVHLGIADPTIPNFETARTLPTT